MKPPRLVRAHADQALQKRKPRQLPPKGFLKSRLVIAESDAVRPVLPNDLPGTRFFVARDHKIRQTGGLKRADPRRKAFCRQFPFLDSGRLVAGDNGNEPLPAPARGLKKTAVPLVQPVKNAKNHNAFV